LSVATRLRVNMNVGNYRLARILNSSFTTELTCERRKGLYSWIGLDVLNLTWTFRWLSAVACIESFGQFVLIRFLCYCLNLAVCMVSIIGSAQAKMVHILNSSSRHVSLEIWQGTLALDTMGGTAVLLIDGPVSELVTRAVKSGQLLL